MKLGLHIYDFTWPGETNQLGPMLAKIAQTADGAGFDRISTMDHVWQSHYLGGPEREVLSCYPTLTYLAAHTSRIKLLALATASPYWHPILLAKTVTTLDVLSGGRAWLGIGAGDYEEEARGSGLPFPPLKERYERLEEMVQICLRMWQGEQGDERPFEGKHYSIERPEYVIPLTVIGRPYDQFPGVDYLVGRGIGPWTMAPVRWAVSMISYAVRSRTS